MLDDTYIVLVIGLQTHGHGHGLMVMVMVMSREKYMLASKMLTRQSDSGR